MNIKIGEKIRILRKKANVNQERFAEYLGVTAQAVSRWEVEGCYPDIELLPSIANFFGVSIDELLCYDTTKNRNRIDEIIRTAGPQRSKKWFDGSLINLFRNSVQEFPNNYELLHCLAKTLCVSKVIAEDREANLIESINICKRILDDCTDDNIRFSTLQVLARAYNDNDEKEKAVEVANRLPSARDSRDMILPEILDDQEKTIQITQSIWLLSDMFEYLILNLANSKFVNSPERRIELFKKILSFDEILHEENDYIYETLRLRAVNYWLAEEYIKLGDYNNALDSIEDFTKYSIQFDLLPEITNYTSIIFDNQTCSKYKDLDMKNASIGSKDLLLSKSIFDHVRSHKRFKACIDKLENHTYK